MSNKTSVNDDVDLKVNDCFFHCIIIILDDLYFSGYGKRTEAHCIVSSILL